MDLRQIYKQMRFKFRTLSEGMKSSVKSGLPPRERTGENPSLGSPDNTMDERGNRASDAFGLVSLSLFFGLQFENSMDRKLFYGTLLCLLHLFFGY